MTPDKPLRGLVGGNHRRLRPDWQRTTPPAAQPGASVCLCAVHPCASARVCLRRAAELVETEAGVRVAQAGEGFAEQPFVTPARDGALVGRHEVRTTRRPSP